MLNELSTMLGQGESLRFQIERTQAGLRVVVQPVLAPIKEHDGSSEPTTAEGKALLQLRAVLARPLVVVFDGADPDQQFRETLTRYSEVRQDATSEFEGLLASMREAATAAASAKSKAVPAKSSVDAKKKSADPAPETPPPAPVSAEPTTAPAPLSSDSLFEDA